MTVTLEILSGAHAGSTLKVDSLELIIGRGADAGLRFDPQRDLSVSARHAVLRKTMDGWVVTDLGSRNGTYVNGRRVQGDARLANGDRIQFGKDGPVARFTEHEPAPLVLDDGRARPGEPPANASEDRSRSGPGITQVVRLRVANETRRLKLTALMVTGALALALATVIVWGRVQQSTELEQVAALRAQLDSILSESREVERDLRGENAGLRDALTTSQDRLEQVQARLERAETSEQVDGLADLERELLAARTALRRQQLASNLDFARLERNSAPAVARIFVQFRGGSTFAATAFAVDSSGLMVTSRHVVEDDDGNGAARIGIQFTGSTQVFPGRLVATSTPAELGVIRIERLAGTVPTIGSLNAHPDTIEAGRPVVVLGFPLGGLAGSREVQSTVPRTITSAGILSTATSSNLEVEAYGAEGSSGSPVLDENGELIGVLFGGRDVDGQRRLVASTSRDLIALLSTL